MSQDFNPYRDWLGVASSSPSPSYYELLGLRPLEADIAKINAAYQRQSGQLAARLSGSQAALAQQLMGELGEARMTLMTPTAKRAYDQALATRNPAVPVSTTRQADVPSANDVDGMLPPAASPQATGPAPAVVPTAVYHAPTPQPYPGQAYAVGVYAAPQGYPAPQGPVAMGVHAASPIVPNYYVAPQAVAAAEVMPMQAQPADGMPSVRRRPARRRASPVPALVGTVVLMAGMLGGLWFYYKGGATVALFSPSDSTSQPNPSPQPQREQTTTQHNTSPPAASNTRPDTQNDLPTPEPRHSPAAVPDPATMESGEAAVNNRGKGGSESRESMPDRPVPETPQPDNPNPEPKPEPKREASPEEAAAVAKALKGVRAALGQRDLAKAKELLDEATIEATAPDTVAQVNRAEMLTSYVEQFWDAARKTLPELQAAETIEIGGKMVAIVEADKDRLVVRAEGRNREYAWTEIPSKIAYYLADRWLASDDPVRNLVLAAFEIVEPKGDLAQAQSLLDAASAARLNAEPLYEELKAARGG